MRQVLDPRCWLHVLLVEYRWIWVTYFTFYALLNNTVTNLDLDPPDNSDNSNTEKYNAMANCVGQKDFRTQHAEFTASRTWSMSPDFELEGGQDNKEIGGGCPALGPCQGHNPFTGTVTDSVRCGCDNPVSTRFVSDKDSILPPSAVCGLLPPAPLRSVNKLEWARAHARSRCITKYDYVSVGDDYGSDPFIINMVGLALTLPVFLGLSLYQICCKPGGFDKKFTPDREYIQSLHNIQLRPWYRTYTNVVAVFALAVGIYGLLELLESSAQRSSVQTHVLGLIALIGIIPRPRRVAPTTLKYSPELINKYVTKVSDWTSKVLVWTSTDFHEYHERLLKFEATQKGLDGTGVFGFEADDVVKPEDGGLPPSDQAQEAWEVRENLFSLFCCF